MCYQIAAALNLKAYIGTGSTDLIGLFHVWYKCIMDILRPLFTQTWTIGGSQCALAQGRPPDNEDRPKSEDKVHVNCVSSDNDNQHMARGCLE